MQPRRFGNGNLKTTMAFGLDHIILLYLFSYRSRLKATRLSVSTFCKSLKVLIVLSLRLYTHNTSLSSFVGEQDEMFGPWGALYPASEFAGHGLFRCDVPTLKTCNFCSKGITVDPTFIIEVPQSNDTSCGALAAYAPFLTWTEEEDDIAKICDSVLLGEELCCPGELAGGDNATILDNTTAETPTK